MSNSNTIQDATVSSTTEINNVSQSTTTESRPSIQQSTIQCSEVSSTIPFNDRQTISIIEHMMSDEFLGDFANTNNS